MHAHVIMLMLEECLYGSVCGFEWRLAKAGCECLG